jgi:hypothetical protein
MRIYLGPNLTIGIIYREYCATEMIVYVHIASTSKQQKMAGTNSHRYRNSTKQHKGSSGGG